jgi:hypothetical protein
MICPVYNYSCYNIDQNEDDRIIFNSGRLHTRRWLSKGNRTSVGSRTCFEGRREENCWIFAYICEI